MKTTALFGLTVTTFLLLAPSTLAKRNYDQQQGAKVPPAAATPAPKTGMTGAMQGGMAGGMPGTLAEHCAMMGQMHEKMESATKAQDTKLKELTDAMDRASGDQKMRAMAAVINELVTQRATRREMQDNMQSQMMGHMMEHMQNGGKAAMMQCPMMPMMGNSTGTLGHGMAGMTGK